jgi:hypothetical protein
MNDRMSKNGVIVMTITLVTTVSATPFLYSQQQPLAAFRAEDGSRTKTITQAPVAISGNNIYVTWWTNDTAKGDGEVMFRASTDGGKTFGDKMNLSNSTNAESQDVQINASGDRVFVTWWERNATSNEPLLRTSTDKGATFGPVMKLSTNGSIGQSSGE